MDLPFIFYMLFGLLYHITLYFLGRIPSYSSLFLFLYTLAVLKIEIILHLLG